MIVKESVECLSCRFMWVIPIKAKIIFCPRCDHKMIKIFEINFCQCGHKNILHEGFDEYGIIGKCTKCICSRFELANNLKQYFIKKYFVTILDKIKRKIIRYLKDKKQEVM